MRANFIKTLAMAGLLLSVSACQMFPLGPDLAKAPSPFGDAPRIVLADPAQDEGAAEIVHTAAGDTTVVHLSEPGDANNRQTFNADVTWFPFDGGDPAYDYWLIGLNIFKTADRSAYVIMRYPHGMKMTRPMDSEGFDILALTCDMRGANPFAKTDAAVDATTDDATAEKTPPPEVATAPQPPCDFKDMAEVESFLPDILAKVGEPSPPSDNAQPSDHAARPDYEWSKMQVNIP